VSVIDRFEEELVARLRELRPLAIEYQQLEQVARRLGLDLDDGHTPARPERAGARWPARRQHRAGRAEASRDFGRGGLSTAQLPLVADVRFRMIMAADMRSSAGLVL
jgi:hypothetical protein